MNRQELIERIAGEETPVPRTTPADLDLDVFAHYYRRIYDTPLNTHFSRPRNEIIARVLLNLGYVNILGSGIPRMIRLARQHSGKDPDLEVRDDLFFVRLWARTDLVTEEE